MSKQKTWPLHVFGRGRRVALVAVTASLAGVLPALAAPSAGAEEPLTPDSTTIVESVGVTLGTVDGVPTVIGTPQASVTVNGVPVDPSTIPGFQVSAANDDPGIEGCDHTGGSTDVLIVSPPARLAMSSQNSESMYIFHRRQFVGARKTGSNGALESLTRDEICVEGGTSPQHINDTYWHNRVEVTGGAAALMNSSSRRLTNGKWMEGKDTGGGTVDYEFGLPAKAKTAKISGTVTFGKTGTNTGGIGQRAGAGTGNNFQNNQTWAEWNGVSSSFRGTVMHALWEYKDSEQNQIYISHWRAVRATCFKMPDSWCAIGIEGWRP